MRTSVSAPVAVDTPAAVCISVGLSVYEPASAGTDAEPTTVAPVRAGLGGRFWLALILPRNKLLDQLSDAPLARTMIQRLPTFFRPQAVAYGHVVAIDGTGKVLASLQDPGDTYRLTTGALEARDYIYVGSLVMPSLGRLPKAKAGL